MQDRRQLDYPNPITLQEAIEADDELFHRLVNADLRSMCHDSVSEILRSPFLVDRWIYHLNTIKRRIEGQLARHRTTIQSMLGDQAAIEAFVRTKASWKAAAIAMRTGAEGRLVEARYLSKGYHTALMELIKRHRDYVRANPGNSAYADQELWKVLDYPKDDQQ